MYNCHVFISQFVFLFLKSLKKISQHTEPLKKTAQAAQKCIVSREVWVVYLVLNILQNFSFCCRKSKLASRSFFFVRIFIRSNITSTKKKKKPEQSVHKGHKGINHKPVSAQTRWWAAKPVLALWIIPPRSFHRSFLATLWVV